MQTLMTSCATSFAQADIDAICDALPTSKVPCKLSGLIKNNIAEEFPVPAMPVIDIERALYSLQMCTRGAQLINIWLDLDEHKIIVESTRPLGVTTYNIEY
jgi:hypothetical protein